MATRLTAPQQKILDFILECRAGSGIPPTLAEIASRFGYQNRATARQHLQALEKKGAIRRKNNKSRAIEVTPHPLFVPSPVMGEVAAGNPLTIYPDAIDTVNLPRVTRFPPESFLLKVKGDSLKDAFIFSGDIIIVNPNAAPVNGNIVAAVLEDAAVVKRFYRKGENIELHSENPEYQPIIISPAHPQFRVVGVVVGVYRSMEKKVI